VSDEPTAGTPAQPLPPPDFPPPEVPLARGRSQTILYGRETNRIAVAAGVCGIIAVVLCWIPFVDYLSIVLGVLAIIFGIVGLRRADAYGSGRAMAITGIVCGAVGLAIAFLFLLLIYAVVSTVTFIGAAVA
jgi:hypothetical protein